MRREIYGRKGRNNTKIRGDGHAWRIMLMALTSGEATITSIPAGEEVSYTFPTFRSRLGGHYNEGSIINQDYDRSDNESSASMTNDTYCRMSRNYLDHKSLYLSKRG